MTTTSHSVDRGQWRAFANQFTHAHDGWPASLEVREPGSPVRVEVDESPFRGLTVEDRNGHETLVMTFGDEPEEHFAHIIHDPRAIATAETEEHAGASIVVDGGDYSRCVLALWNPTREEDFAGA